MSVPYNTKSLLSSSQSAIILKHAIVYCNPCCQNGEASMHMVKIEFLVYYLLVSHMKNN